MSRLDASRPFFTKRSAIRRNSRFAIPKRRERAKRIFSRVAIEKRAFLKINRKARRLRGLFRRRRAIVSAWCRTSRSLLSSESTDFWRRT